MSKVLNAIKKPILLTLSMMVLCGLIYPLLLTGISAVIFPHQAQGSLITVGDKIVGSEIVGQNFTDAKFMKCRPSAVKYNTYTAEDKENGTYAGVGSGSQNFAPTNPALAERVKTDMEAFLAAHPEVKKEDIPTDLLTASGSGLDPHISPTAAAVQIPAIAKATGLSSEQIETFVATHTKDKVLGIFGEQTVNVLQVNLEIAKALGIIG